MKMKEKRFKPFNKILKMIVLSRKHYIDLDIYFLDLFFRFIFPRNLIICVGKIQFITISPELGMSHCLHFTSSPALYLAAHWDCYIRGQEEWAAQQEI